MNSHEKIFLIAVLLLLATILVAQNGPSEVVLVAQETTKKLEIPEATTSGYRFTKRLPATFSGYAIEIWTSDFPLEKDYTMFKGFGKVYHYKTDEGTYSYLLLTKYRRERAVQDYMDKVLLKRLPHAKIIRYKNGQRSVPSEVREQYYPID